jgi:hypothetical protein
MYKKKLKKMKLLRNFFGEKTIRGVEINNSSGGYTKSGGGKKW